MTQENNCLFCEQDQYTDANLLYENELFRVKCDDNPITKGHILIIPKRHASCIGAYTPAEYTVFRKLYEQCCEFTESQFGSVSSFEHGVLGQTIFHSHVHVLPFTGSVTDIVPEGNEHIRVIEDLTALWDELQTNQGYLYFKINSTMMLADRLLAEPRFFRDRYAVALGNADRKNWREISKDPELVRLLKSENAEVIEQWRQFA